LGFEQKVHEGTITTQLVQSVLRQAADRNAKKVTEVNLEIGRLTFLNPEQVRFWFKILTKGTIMEHSRLVIRARAGTVRCSQCHYEGDFRYEDDASFHIPVPTLRCPKCNASVKIVDGKDCVIRRVKMIV
jgi:hydrogenase nickel incorporation protein HypA/HybF